MRIVHALGWYFPESLGGTEIYVASLCRYQRARGDDIYVAAPFTGGATGTTYEHEGTPVFRYPIAAEPTRDEAQTLVAARGAEQLHAWLAAVRPDILHVHSFVTGLGLFEMRAAKATGARIVVTHHLPRLGYLCRVGSLYERGRAPCDGVAGARRCATCALMRSQSGCFAKQSRQSFKPKRGVARRSSSIRRINSKSSGVSTVQRCLL